MRTSYLVIAAVCALPHPIALAQPSPPVADKVDAKSLMQSGLKLYAARDYLGALSVFRTAYTRFPSAKILLNIGTTLTKLDRKADAANTYQRYLDAPDTDPAKAADVKKLLAELDQAVGTLELTISPSDAELQIGSEDWIAATAAQRQRVPPGTVAVQVRRAAYEPAERELQVAAGQTVAVAFDLVEIPVPQAPLGEPGDGGVRAAIELEAPRSAFGVVAMALIDAPHHGGAGLVGVTFDVTEGLRVQAGAILGPSYGGYLGGTLALLDGKLRPIVSAGAPIFLSSGARIALRGAGGLELALTHRLALTAELGIEYMLNPEADVRNRTLLIPAVGAAGWL